MRWAHLFSIHSLQRPNLAGHTRFAERWEGYTTVTHLELGPCWAARSSYVGRLSPPDWSCSGTEGTLKGSSDMVGSARTVVAQILVDGDLKGGCCGRIGPDSAVQG